MFPDFPAFSFCVLITLPRIPSNLQMPTEPIGQRGLADQTAGNTFHGLNRIQGIETQVPAVVGQEQACDDPGSTFVAVDEAVVLRETVGIRGCESSRVRIARARRVDRMGQSRFNRPQIANAVCPAVLGELTVMDRKHDTRFNPTPWARVVGAHLARARSTSRSSCIISSASAS